MGCTSDNSSSGGGGSGGGSGGGGGKYFAKYRGKVANNIDLMGLGRIQVTCPAVLGEGKLSWAMPCSPYAGSGVGLFVLPPVGANIWVEFEGGDPDYPIWSGCFWGAGELAKMLPATVTPLAKDYKVFKTDTTTIIINDLSSLGGVSLEIEAKAVTNKIKLVCDSKGVALTVGSDVAAKLTSKDITFSVCKEVSEKLTTKDITLAVGKKTKAALSAKGIEMTGADKSKVSLKESAIEATNGDSKTKIESSGIGLENGSGSVKVESSGVNINKGAVEVK